jgi:beta-galactosidase/beta-glucuronidase
VPGTVEEYLHPGNGPAGDFKGVSWWWRTIRIPENAGARIVLHFESQRHRAEIYLDHQLVGYDVIGGTPFEADLTGKVKPGQVCQLAVRITDPGGNFDWRDSSPFSWGTNSLPMSHGFGGITGPVKIVATDPVFVDDIYVQNTPAITNVNVVATIRNTAGKKVSRDLIIDIVEKQSAKGSPAFEVPRKGIELNPGENIVTQKVSVASAKLWDLEHPNLYVCTVGLDRKRAQLDTA